MAKNIEPSLKSIGDYLSQKKKERFVIPEYQRGYSWDIAQCDKLWQDIEDFIEVNGGDGDVDPYFFGTIILDCSTDNNLNLIDGQQRTITFLLLLKALLIRLDEVISKIDSAKDFDNEGLINALKRNRENIVKILYKVEEEDVLSILKNKEFKNVILETKSINELYPNEFTKIIEAADFGKAEEAVCKIPSKHKDNKYTNYFRNFKFFYDKLSERNKSESKLNQFSKMLLKTCQIIEIRSWQVEQAIMMFNSLNSTGLPLSDADIISAQLYANAKQINEETSKKFNEVWKDISELAEKLEIERITDISGILQQYMYISRAIDKEYVKQQEENVISVDVTTPGVRRYYTEIRKDLLKNPLELIGKIKKLTDIWHNVKNYSIIKILLKANVNVKLFLAGYLFRYEAEKITEKDILEVCLCLLKLFTLLELDEASYSSTKYKTFLFRQMINFVREDVSTELIKEEFDEHIAKNWNKKDIYERILNYEKNFLVFVNEYLFAQSKGIELKLEGKENIEHIMPRSGKNISTIRQDAKISSEEEFLSLVNKIGNKILLEEELNKSISNEWFRTKKQTSIKNKTGYKDSIYPIAQHLTMYPKDTWEKEDIEKATKKAAERIVKFIFGE